MYDRPRENRPSSHLVMIVEIPVLKFLIGITSFCLCKADYILKNWTQQSIDYIIVLLLT